ncbi:MAG: glycosyltransferase family 2 protein [Candidatus Shapirobacteria bacterium]
MSKSKSKLPLVSIIIPNFNGEKFINKCLGSIYQETKISFEVVVIDNGSTDKSVKLLKKQEKKRKNLKVIALKKNVGPAEARNIGRQNSLGHYLVILDYDTIVGPDWLGKSLKYLEKHPKIGVAQLKIIKMGTNNYDCAGEKITQFGFLSERARGAKDLGQFNRVEDIFSGKTAAMIIRKNAFDRAGGFDKEIFMYWEEPDFCWRVWKTGFRVVFLPLGKVWHAYGTKDKKVSKTHATWITHQGCRNQIIIIIKNASKTHLVKMLLAIVFVWLALLLSFLLKFDWPRAKAVLKAFGWLIAHPKILYHKRKNLIAKLGQKYYQDNLWLDKVLIKRSLNWYLGKAFSYLTNQPF